MNRNNKKATNFKSSYRDSSKNKPTKIFIDSSKKVTAFKDEEKQAQNNNKEIKKEKEELTLEEQKQKRDKIIHENNIKVIDMLQKDFDKIEEENKLIMAELERLKEEEKELLKKYEDIRIDIETEKDELEELKEINDEKNREYSHLVHLRHRTIMDSPNNQSEDSNRSNNNNTNNERPHPLNRFTLGDVMDGLLSISRIRRENEDGEMVDSPFFVIHSRENNEDGPPMSYSQIQALPSSNYPRNNYNNEKCTICEFVFCYNDVVTKLIKCSHTFHKSCLVNRLTARQSSKCPTCRISII